MSSAIQNIIQHSIGDGARAAKFEVQVLLPSESSFKGDDVVSVMAKAASFPSKVHEVTFLKHKGRTIPVRGQTKYNHTWDCTFYLTEDHSLKQAFEQWIEAIDQQHNYDNPINLGADKLQRLFATADTAYTMPIVISQLNFDMDKPTVAYIINNAFPTSISSVDVSADNTGNLLEFTVTFTYTHYTVNTVSGNTSNPAKDIESQLNNLLKGAVQDARNYFSGMANNIVSTFTSTVSRAFNSATGEVVGKISNVVDNLFDSLL